MPPNNDTQNTIYGVMRQEINDFVNNYIEVVPGYNFSQYQTIKRNHLYVNSRFYDQSLFSGREKMFFNISKFRKDAAVTLIDIDTKDIRVFPSNPKSEWSTFFLEKELKLWLKQNHISKKLNEMADEACTQGSVVLKKTKKGANIIDLRRLFLDPTVERIKQSRFITIKHYFTTSELRAKVKDGWNKDAIEAIILKSKGRKSFAPQSYENNGMQNPIVSSPFIEVYERYGELDAHYLKKTGEPIRCLAIVAEPFQQGHSQDGKYEWDEGEILFLSEWVGEYPFNDFHYSKTRGRWLGVGVIEELWPIQERFNELSNQKRIAMEVSAMHLFQTADTTVVDNILTDLQSGDLIKTKNPGAITPLANEERNLGAFEFEDRVYNELADKVSAVNDVISGQSINSSTPATNANIANTNAKAFFKFKRQNFAIFLREFFEEFVLPNVVKDISTEHVLRFLGDVNDIQKLDEAHATVVTNDAVFNYIASGKPVPSPLDVDTLKQMAINNLRKQGNSRFVNIAKDFYSDTEFEFDILIDEEETPIATLAQNTFQLLTSVAQNPQLLTNPVTKALIYDWAEKIGINPVKLEMAEANTPPQQQVQQPQQQQQPQALQNLAIQNQQQITQ